MVLARKPGREGGGGDGEGVAQEELGVGGGDGIDVGCALCRGKQRGAGEGRRVVAGAL
ncbi:MAG: hypothetical protein QXP27_08730 [Candidatus Methanomethyliaceae archaeon]